MTVVEFFDKNAIENMLSAMLCQPEKVLFVGNSKKQMEPKLEVYREVLKTRCLQDVELDCIGLDQNNLAHIIEVLSGVVEKTDLCVFNLDGGEDLYLVAVGAVAQRYGSRVQMHRFNVRNNTIVDCDADGNDQLAMPIRISIEENVRIYGGRMIFEDERRGTTPRWVMNEEFCQDIRSIWEVCKSKVGRWNWVFTQLDKLGRNEEGDKEDLRVYIENITQRLDSHEEGLAEVMAVLTALEDKGLIRNVAVDQYGLTFSYKNTQIKQSLLKAGTILELYIAMIARGLFNKEEERVYHDVLTGVWLDWDGRLTERGTADVNNEIDVMMMRGAVPVFVSCKNGDMDVEELFKLETVATRFGGEYARKVLVINQPEKLGSKEASIRLRAAAMGIKLLTDIGEMSVEELETQLRNC